MPYPCRPLILVPGICGSELRTADSWWPSPGRLVWLAPAALLVGWRFLGLAPDGSSPEYLFAPPLVGGGPLPAYYGLLCDWLARHGYCVVSPGLDWRLRQGDQITQLVEAIRDNSKSQPVGIVCHSRGGLLVRVALHVLDQAGELDRVAAVVGLGVPHSGSLAAAQLLGGWQRTKLLLYALLEGASRLLTGGYPPGRLNAIIATWPAVYQLLPAPGAGWIDAAQVARLYDAAAWAADGVTVSAGWLSHAHTEWRALAAVPAGVRWLDVVGVGVSTPLALTGAPLTGPPALAAADDGDGVVAAASAWRGGPQRVRTPCEHSALVYDGRALVLADRYLRGEDVGDVVVRGPTLS